MTDNSGEVQIYRTKKKSMLAKNLRRLKEFLEKQDDDLVEKILG